jgi:two-component system LytT family response regulator
MRIRALVVDDEPLARSNLTVLLRRDPQIATVAECGSGFEALAAIRDTRPDLVFLDVQMPECDGFDLLEMLGGQLPPAVIFVTAYDEFALRAFEAGVLDYLLKPFDDARFGRALERAKERLRGNSPGARHAQGQFAIRSAGQLRFVRIAEVDWIEAADYYVCLHVGTQTHLLRRSLGELARELQEQEFCRIHRSTIVNLKRVCGLDLSPDGDHAVILDSGMRLKLSRRFRKNLQARLGAGA